MIRNGVKEMISKKMENMVANSSAIRAMFEEGNRLAKIYGAENVYDFSLGNPNVPAPEAVKKAMIDILNEEDPIVLHGYTNSNAGYEDVRQAVADSLNERFGTSFAAKNITMTVGAAGGLNVILKALLNPGDEVGETLPEDQSGDRQYTEQSNRCCILGRDDQKAGCHHGRKAERVWHGDLSHLRRAIQRAGL